MQGSDLALGQALEQAERRGAELLMLGDAPAILTAATNAGWQVVATPAPDDTTAITILSRGAWRAANIPGEPAMARTMTNSLTVIGVNPPAAGPDGTVPANDDAEINRSAARAGVQSTPVLAIGDFNLVPWDRALGQFRNYGNVTRVRCGGLFGATRGLLPVDHAFVRDVTVARCENRCASHDQRSQALVGHSCDPAGALSAPSIAGP